MDAQQASELPLAYETAKEAVWYIADYASNADEAELPGLTAALRCVLHIDGFDAGDLVIELRADAERKREVFRLEEWLRTSTIYRVVMDREPAGQTRGVVQYTEARDLQDAVEHWSGTRARSSASAQRFTPERVRVLECRRAGGPDDIDELLEMEKEGF